MGVDLLRKNFFPFGVAHLRLSAILFAYSAVTAAGRRRVDGILDQKVSYLRTSVADVESPLEQVFLVSCTDSETDTRVQMLMNRAQSMGYTPHWLNCSDAFSKQAKPLWGVRMKQYQQFVEDIPGDPLVAFVDGMDVIAEGSAFEAASRFEEFDTSLVISCVSYPYPLDCAAYAGHRPSGPCSYPCAGASMGRASGFRTLFRQGGNFSAETDDQCWLYSALNDHMMAGHEYKLDSQSRLFLSYTSNIAWHLPYSLDHGRHVVDAPGLESHPTFIHLDTGHPTPQRMVELQACTPGSDQALCNQMVAGWWPAPASQKMMDRVVCGLTFLLVVLAVTCAAHGIHKKS